MISDFFIYLKRILFSFLIICIIIIILTSILFCNISNVDYTSNSVISYKNFTWPIPGYTSISSFFGKRTSPTTGASSYHSGIDIPAPEGTPLFAIDDGTVYFASWGAGGGYTISYSLQNQPQMQISYCHVSPIMYVSKGDTINKGQVVGTVGPKNVYGILNNQYKDSNGNPTNGATTGCHLHFTIKQNNKPIDPLLFYEI